MEERDVRAGGRRSRYDDDEDGGVMSRE
jgi:hypothetical protein